MNGARAGGAGKAAAFLALAGLMLLPGVSPALALAVGAAFALGPGNPFPSASAGIAKHLLQASVVGLGFGIPLAAIALAGASGVVYTVAGIATALVLGSLLGRWLRTDRDTSLLVTVGTAICGGSAIAAVGAATSARAEAMTVSLATVFVLNAVALLLFPPLGHALGLSQEQFAVWAAVAIHDTSSVVGAAAAYGPRALESATILKLARALWIVPLTVAAAAWHRRRSGDAGRAAPLAFPWFIGFFLLAAAVRTLAPAALVPALDLVVRLARSGLVLTLFLIGAGLSREVLRAVGARPLVHAVLLWVSVGGLALAGVWAWMPSPG